MTDTAVDVELELTYLAARLPDELNGTTPKEMQDVYVPADLSIHPRVRLRRKGDRYEFTKKTPISDGDASAHNEETVRLTEAEYKTLASASNRSVSKDRYNVVLGDHPAEVDVFTGPLAGLVLIDFEFDSAEALRSFTPPKECLADVTQEDFVAGGLLAGRSYADIEGDLQRFGYTRIDVS